MSNRIMQPSAWRDRSLVACVALACGLALPGEGFAAERVAGSPTKTTQVILTLDTQDTVRIRTRSVEQPPALIVEFPGQQVSGSLPERSVSQHGVISEIRTRYRTPRGRSAMRIIDSVRIELTGPYSHRVREEPGHIIIEIDHPAGVMGETVEVGLRGGTILSGLARNTITERFRAMQEALVKASPTGWTWRATSAPRAKGRDAGTVTTPGPPAEVAATGLLSPLPPRAPQPRPTAGGGTFSWALLLGMMALLGGGVAWWLRIRAGVVTSASRSGEALRPVATGAAFIEQLVWRAFERQGYQLIRTIELAQPQAMMRVMAKDGTNRGLFCLMDGPFIEKDTIERCIEALRQASLEQGVVVAFGSFTVPAQRRAKEAQVTLIGRAELVELLSAGATTEYFSKELEQLSAQLDESTAGMKQYAHELESLRRQRNEASWSLGEERARRAQLETETSEVSRQLHQAEAHRERSHTEMASLQRRWEENQWYLGEAKARMRYLEEQVSQLQEIAQGAEATRQERDDASAHLGEERIHREQLTAQLQALTDQIKQSVARERALQDQMERLKEDLAALQAHGDRRRALRGSVADATVELHDRENCVIFSGGLRDLSGAGVGFDGEQACSVGDPLRISLRLPGRARPITSQGRLVWQRKDPQTSRYRSGCRFVGLRAADQALIEHAIT